MKAVDTNVLLRLIVTDDARQTAIAEHAIERPTFVSLTVLMEAAWVLRSIYGFERQRIARTLQALIALPTIVVEDEDGVIRAIKRYGATKADLEDMLHLVAARAQDGFATFDRKLSAQAGRDSPIPVETLG